jgi:hypothetical protein
MTWISPPSTQLQHFNNIDLQHTVETTFNLYICYHCFCNFVDALYSREIVVVVPKKRGEIVVVLPKKRGEIVVPQQNMLPVFLNRWRNLAAIFHFS